MKPPSIIQNILEHFFTAENLIKHISNALLMKNEKQPKKKQVIIKKIKEFYRNQIN